MKKQYLQTQDIFNRVFVNANGAAIKASLGLHSEQDYLNAVYAPESSALRIRLEGGMLPAVTSVAELPAAADPGVICPVITDSGIAFYRYDAENGWELLSATGEGQTLDPEQAAAVAWLTANLAKIQTVADSKLVQETIFELHGGADGESPYATIAGSDTRLEIADPGDSDGDPDTEYRLDVAGYVLAVETYAAGAVIPDRYYTKIVYEAAAGAAGVSRIYLDAAEFAEFAAREAPYNTLRVHYTLGPFGGATVERLVVEIPCEGASPVDDALEPTPDAADADGDPATIWRVPLTGYVLNVECYPDADATLPARFPAKMHYDPAADSTGLYLEAGEYDAIAAYGPGKNIIVAYRLAARV